MYVSYDTDYIIRAISSYPLFSPDQEVIQVNDSTIVEFIGKKIPYKYIKNFIPKPKDSSLLRVAIICNWNDKCGISTYSKKIITAMIPMVKEIKVFSEAVREKTHDDENFVQRCWTRGEQLLDLAKEIIDWNPDFIIIQHEFGLFPNGFYFMQLMEQIKNIPYAVVMHSAYEHLDKAVYCEACKNIIVHSNQGKEILEKIGVSANITVIPHGCDTLEDTSELWNILQNPYTIMQFGFGFEYKGVEVALQAISHLKRTDSKFKNIFYFYLCSSNNYNSSIHVDYYNKIKKMIIDLGIQNNVSIISKYQSDEMINRYLRLAKIAIFPYLTKEGNRVYGASGAIRVAMSNKRPVIASNSSLFDDLEGIIPRPANYIELAKEIDEIFSNNAYRKTLVNKSYQYVLNNSWASSAEKYLNVYHSIVKNYTSE